MKRTISVIRAGCFLEVGIEGFDPRSIYAELCCRNRDAVIIVMKRQSIRLRSFLFTIRFPTCECYCHFESIHDLSSVPDSALGVGGVADLPVHFGKFHDAGPINKNVAAPLFHTLDIGLPDFLRLRPVQGRVV